MVFLIPEILYWIDNNVIMNAQRLLMHLLYSHVYVHDVIAYRHCCVLMASKLITFIILAFLWHIDEERSPCTGDCF